MLRDTSNSPWRHSLPLFWTYKSILVSKPAEGCLPRAIVCWWQAGTLCELRSHMVDFYVSSGRWSCPLPVQGPRPGAFESFKYKINRIGECLCVCVRDKEKVRGWLLLSELQSLDTLLGHCQSFQPHPLSDTLTEGAECLKANSWLHQVGWAWIFFSFLNK